MMREHGPKWEEASALVYLRDTRRASHALAFLPAEALEDTTAESSSESFKMAQLGGAFQ